MLSESVRGLAQPTPRVFSKKSLGDFDLDVALAAIWHAGRVYEDPGKYRAAVRRVGFGDAQIISRGNTQVGLAWSPQTILVTPRGSNQLGDWIEDLLALIKVSWEYGAGRIGLGFRRQLDRIAPDLLQRLDALLRIYPHASLSIQGHSLGGILAQLCGAMLANRGFPVRQVYSFNAPRGGDADWAKGYRRALDSVSACSWAVVHAVDGVLDVVSRIPKKRWGFRGVDERLVLTNTGRIFAGHEHWLRFRQRNPVGHITALGIILRGIHAHRSIQILRSLLEARRQAG